MRDRPVWISLLGLMVATVGVLGRQPAPPAAATTAVTTAVTLDPFASTASDVARHHHDGHVVQCELRIGVWEPGRPDADRYPVELLGSSATAGARWIDIRRWDILAPILADRLKLCLAKGFDGVVMIDLTGPRSGFALTDDDRTVLRRRVTELARTLGLAPSEPAAAEADTAGTRTTTGS